MVEVLIIIIIIVILITLGLGLTGLLKGGKTGSDRIFKSLRMRAGLSIALFLFVIFTGYMGWIQPNIVMLDAPATQASIKK